MNNRKTRTTVTLAALLAGTLALPGLAAADRGRAWDDGPRAERYSNRGWDPGHRREAYDDRGRDREWGEGRPHHHHHGWWHGDGHRGGRETVVIERPVDRRPAVTVIPLPGMSVILPAW
jgi:hypothetical protein